MALDVEQRQKQNEQTKNANIVQRWAQIVMRHHPLILYAQSIGTGTEAELIDIALVDLYGHIVFHSPIQPSQLPLQSDDPEATIDNDLLKQAPTFSELWKQLRPALTSYEIIIYDAATTLRNLRQVATRAQLILPAIISDCLQTQYSIYTDGEQANLLKPASFAEACTAFKISVDPHNMHNATSNAEATRLLLIALATAKEAAH